MSDGRPLRLATRGSPQAATQAQAVADRLVAAGIAAELVIVDTTGDRRRDVPLHSIGGIGVFTKEVSLAVLDGRADAAVHSAKDLPTTPTEGLGIAAFCVRRDPADVLVGSPLAELDAGATVATGSVRRRAQLAARRPDLNFVELRGNIATRLGQIPAGGAIVIAAAALEVLDIVDRTAERLDPRLVVPAVGQGCVAVECRTDDERVVAALSAVDDASTRRAVELERIFLAAFGTGCSLPIGAHVDGAQLAVFVADSDVLVPGERPRAVHEVVDLAGVAGADAVAVTDLAGSLQTQLEAVTGAAQLGGVRVVLTRDDAELAAALGELGADVETVVLTVVDAAGRAGELRESLADLADIDWLAVTSANGVAAIAAARPQLPEGVRIAAVGNATAAAVAAQLGRRAALVPRDQRAAGLVAAFPGERCRVMIVQAEAAAPTLAEGLRAAGHDVAVVTGYRTVPRALDAAEVAKLRTGAIVVVSSGSACAAWLAVDEQATQRNVTVVAIGPTTAGAATTAGFHDVVTAARPDVAALVDAVRSAAGS